MGGHVVAVSSSGAHSFSKQQRPQVELVAGLGVAGDAHQGARVRHRSRVRVDPDQPNLRQVHLIHGELLDEVAKRGFAVEPGQLGENVTTRGVDLLGLPTGTTLRLGDTAIVALTGLRNPCGQINGLADGLRSAVVDHDADGGLIRKAGVMAVVLHGGTVRPGDPIALALPPGPASPLAPV